MKDYHNVPVIHAGSGPLDFSDYYESDPLLQTGSGPLEFPKSSHAATRRRNRLLDIGLSIAMPTVIFVVVLVLFIFYVYREVQFVVWFVVVVCGVGAVLLLCVGAFARHGAFFLLGCVTLTSLVTSVVVGRHVNSEYLEHYWTVKAGLTYKSVDPSSTEAAGLVDAGVLHFTSGTLVDDRRTIGLIADGSIHCVAPVVKETRYSTSVQYWATGIDCCEEKSHFNCGSAMDSRSKIAIVAKSTEHLSSAIAEAISAYSLHPTQQTRIVSFVSNPEAAADDIWDDALEAVLVASVLQLCFVIAVVVIIYVAVPSAMGPIGSRQYRQNMAFKHGSTHGSSEMAPKASPQRDILSYDD